jgi:hypothetical protein
MNLTGASARHAACGRGLPASFVPQIKACLRDTSTQKTCALSKAAAQTGPRAAKLLLVLQMDSLVAAAALLDVLGRCGKLAAALHTLRHQG